MVTNAALNMSHDQQVAQLSQ